MLLTLCMVLGLLPGMTLTAGATGGATTLYVNGVNMLDESSTAPAGVSYDKSTNTLTLENAALSKPHNGDANNAEHAAVIYSTGNLTIDLVGSSTITYSTSGTATFLAGIVNTGGNLKFTGSGSLTIKNEIIAAGNNKCYNGICSYGALTVDNPTITIDAEKTMKCAEECGVFVAGAFAIEKGTVTIRTWNTTTRSNIALCVANGTNSTLGSGAKLIAEAGNSGNDTKSYGIMLQNSSLKLEAGASLRASGGKQALSMSTGTISAASADLTLSATGSKTHKAATGQLQTISSDSNTLTASQYKTIEVTASAAGGAEGAHDHSQGWTELTAGGNPKSGKYYLSGDLTLTKNLIINGTDVTICLNGHVLMGNKSDDYNSVIQVQSGGTLTICDCKNTKHEGYIDAEGLWKAGDSVPDGCTEYNLTGGVITGGNPGISGEGGAVNIASGTTVTFTGGNIAGNTAGYGGGVYNKGTLNLDGGKIVGNKGSSYGGGVCSAGGTVKMTGGDISYNTTDSGNDSSQGGGVYSGSTFNMTGGTISHNHVNGTGGGVYFAFGSEGSITDGTITHNTASKLAAGVYCNTIKFTLSGTVNISENEIRLGTGGKSNLYLDASSSTNVILSVTDALNTASRIGISGSKSLYRFAQGSYEVLNGRKDCFFADDPTQVVAVEGSPGSSSNLKLDTNPTPYTVSFEANGGGGTMAPKKIAGGQYTLPKCDFTAPTGKLFAGWALSADGQVISTYTVDKDFTLYAIWRESDPVSIRNGGYPYLKKIVNGQMILAMDAEGDGVTYQWQSADSEKGEYRDISGETSSTYTFYLASEKWYRCMVSGKPSKAVRAVKSSSSWTTTGTKWYLSNGTMAYTTDGTSFDVVGLYQKNGTDYMMSVSKGGWEMYSSTAPEPAAGNSATASLDALKVSFSEKDAHVLNFEADLKAGHQAFAFGCDTQLGNRTTSGKYYDTGALKAMVKDGKLSQIAMVGAETFAAAQDADPAFVIKPLDPAASRFWIGDKLSRETYAYNTSGGDATETVGGQEAVTLVKNTDSGMTMSWMNVPSGGSVKFQFSVGSVKDTGVDRGEEVVGSVTAVTVTPNKEVSVNKGGTQQFKATVSGTGTYDKTVTWKIENANSRGTTISDSGLLTVGADETAPSIAVIATSKGDRTKSCTVPVNIPQATSVSLSQTYWYPTAVGEKLTLTATIPASYDSARWDDQKGYIELAEGTDAFKGGTDTHIDTTVTVELKRPCWAMIQISAGPNGGRLQSATCYVKAGHQITIDPKSDGNDGNGLEYVYTFDNPYTLPSIEDYFTVPDGKRFKAWSVNGAEYQAGQTVTIPVPEKEKYGSLTITAVWEKIPVTTYTVTYNTNGGTLPEHTATTNNSGKLTSLPNPTYAGHVFKGWYDAVTGGNQITTDTVFTQDTTIYAQWIKAYSVSGNVVNEADSSAVDGATVTIGKIETTTGTDGSFTLSDIPAGEYNIVVTTKDDSKIVTKLVKIENKDVSDIKVVIPTKNLSSVVEVKPATPAVLVGGLDELAKAKKDEGTTVVVKLTVEQKAENAVAEAVKNGIVTAAAKDKLEYLDMNVNMTVDSNPPSPISDTGKVLEIIVPYDMAGKYNIAVYRHHDNQAQAFRKLENRPTSSYRDGTFFVGNDFIVIYTQKFSTYAIGYNTQSSGGSGSGGSSSSSGSSSSGNSSTISTPSAKNGTVSVSPKSASKGTTVTVTVTPDKGYVLETLTATDASGKKLDLKNLGSGKYSFTMPASKVEVKATFMEDNTMLNYFVDVPASAYYYDAVLWAAEHGITGGTDATHFPPDGVCTRAQAVTFLWRAAGSPAPSATAMPFTDVAADSYYYNAVLWAMENGITVGTSSTTFSPDLKCSRAHIMTFLWRSEKSPAAGSVNPFTDVSAGAYYADAVLWAVKESVTSGTSSVTFSPDADCIRAQIVTFIWRTLAR